jgi:lysophospholipase L1-like esterase
LKIKARFVQTLYYATSALIMPLLLMQAIWVRLTVLRLPEPCGNRSGRCGHGNDMKLLIIGDSAAAGVGVDKQKDALAGQLTATLAAKYNVSWCLIANTGCTSSDVITKLTALSSQTFDYVLVSVGVNDVTHLTRSRHWSNNLNTLVKLLNTKFGSPNILLTSVPPMQRFTAIPTPLRWWLGLRAKKLNELMTRAIEDKNNYSILTFDLPFKSEYIAKDGIHPSKVAYSVWANQAADKIDKLINS